VLDPVEALLLDHAHELAVDEERGGVILTDRIGYSENDHFLDSSPGYERPGLSVRPSITAMGAARPGGRARERYFLDFRAAIPAVP